MSLLGNLILVSRTVSSVTRRPNYHLAKGPAIPSINQGNAKGYGNGLTLHVRRELERQRSPKPARLNSASAAQIEEPSSPLREITAPAAYTEPVPSALVEPQRIPALPGPGTRPIEAASGLAGEPGTIEAPSLRGLRPRPVRGKWWKISTWLRRPEGPWVQAELRLEDVRPLRSSLGDDSQLAKVSERKRTFRPGGRNPFGDSGVKTAPEAQVGPQGEEQKEQEELDAPVPFRTRLTAMVLAR